MIDDINSVGESVDSPINGEQIAAVRPRIWSAICVPLLAIFGATVFAGVVLVSAIAAHGLPLDPNNIADAMTQILSEPIGIWIAVLPGQAVFIAAALFAAFLSPIRMGERLQMSRTSEPVWMWIIFAIATPSIGITMTLLVQFSGFELSQQLESMNQIMAANSGGQFVIAAILIGIVPGFTEEFLFRGYVQSRLLKRWSPIAAIGVSAAIFSIAHLDPMHVFLVFPIGIWLGIVAWQTGSVWPAVLCHSANNLLAVVLAQFEPGTTAGPTDFILLVPCCLAMIASVFLMSRASKAGRAPTQQT